MRKTCPSTYDPKLTSEDIRAFKQLLQQSPAKLSKNLKEARWIDNGHARVWTGRNIGGCMIDFLQVNGEWTIGEVVHYIS
jgi:hypothetical protein